MKLCETMLHIIRRAYDSKQIEFIEYCKHVYSKDDDYLTITDAKVYGLMLYQCHRTKKKGKGVKWKNGTPRFQSHDYDKVLKNMKMKLFQPKSCLNLI